MTRMFELTTNVLIHCFSTSCSLSRDIKSVFCTCVFMKQITGQPSVLYYADTIFQDVGLSSSASVLTATFKLLATLCAVFTVDKHGRYVRCVLTGDSTTYCSCVFMVILLVCAGYPMNDSSHPLWPRRLNNLQHSFLDT